MTAPPTTSSGAWRLLTLGLLALARRSTAPSPARAPATAGKRPGGARAERRSSVAALQRLDAREGKGPGGGRDAGGSAGPDHLAGRGAASPAQIPARGWWALLRRTWDEFNNDRILAVAGGVTFFALLALFPAIAAFVSLYGLVADVSTVREHLNALSGVLPGGAIELLGGEIQRITGEGDQALGLAFATTLGLSLWSANSGVKAVFDGLNVAYDEPERRGFFELNAVSLLFTLGAILFLVLAVSAVVVVPAVLAFLGLKDSGAALLALLRWPVLLGVMVLALAVLYRFGPSRKKPEWRWITWGSSLASVFWLVGSLAFSWYVQNFGDYNATYGSLGAAIGFMTWIWLSSTVILAGAELNAELEQQAEGDAKAPAGAAR